MFRIDGSFEEGEHSGVCVHLIHSIVEEMFGCGGRGWCGEVFQVLDLEVGCHVVRGGRKVEDGLIEFLYLVLVGLEEVCVAVQLGGVFVEGRSSVIIMSLNFNKLLLMLLLHNFLLLMLLPEDDELVGEVLKPFYKWVGQRDEFIRG